MKEFDECVKMAQKFCDIEELFECWKEVHGLENDYEDTTVTGVKKETFVEDGYIDRAKYDEAKIKVLFILKEANEHKIVGSDSQNLIKSQIPFYINYIESGEGLNRPKQQEKMGRMAYYLQNPDLEIGDRKTPTDAELKGALRKSSFMNLNKRGGTNRVTYKFQNYTEKYMKFILKQVELINPTFIVILGSGMDSAIKEIENAKICGNDKIIRHWHTAYSMPKKKREDNPKYGDKNVDLYMREFFKRCEGKKRN